MKLGTLLSDLAKKAGVDTTQPEFVALLSHDIEIPEGIGTALNKGLLNLEAAKNNPEIKKLIRTETLNGVDAKVAEILEEMGITEADDITTEKNSFEKIKRLSQKIKEVEEKKAKTTKAPEKDALEKQIADLNKEIKAAKDGLVAKEKEWQDTRNGDLTNFDIQKKLLGKDYALPKEMNADLKVTTAQSAINMALAAKGLKLVRNEQGNLQILDKDGNKAYSDNHEELQVDSFIDGALAQNKLLKVNDDQSQGGGGNNGQQQHIPPGGGGQKQNTNAVSAIDSQLKDLGLTG
jgi:predicted  nucleic acid-binding Zn-ribbon protein